LTVAAVASEFAAEFDEAGRRWVVEDAEEVVTFFGRQFEGRVLSGESSFVSVGESEVWVAADLEEQVDECAAVVPGDVYACDKHGFIVESRSTGELLVFCPGVR
jgi:hypothetical protein